MRVLIFSFLLVGLLAGQTAQAQEKNADTLVQKIFISLKQNDEQAFMKLFPSYTQIRALFSDMVANIKDTNQRKEASASFARFDEKSYNEDIGKQESQSFQNLLQQARDKGINWKETSLVNSVYEEVKIEEVGGKTLKGTINLKEKDQEYVIHFSDVVWSNPDQGWFGVNLMGITKKGEPLQEDVIMTDSAVLVDTVPVPPSPPKVKKLTPATKKSTATKPVAHSSPARKPKTKS